MKIMIIEPPRVSKFGNQRIFGGNGSNKSDFRKPPLDLMMISGYLRKEGFDNILIDANASGKMLEDVRNVINEEKPDIIFFSTSTSTVHKDLLIAEAAKSVSSSILTAAIGTHVMALPDEVLRACPTLDIGVYASEWEQVALNVLKCQGDLSQAKGIVYRKSVEEIVRTDVQLPIECLDDLGFPAHDKLNKEIYRDPTTRRFPKTMVMGQKACINNCSFCCQPAFFGAPVLRKRSVAHFLEELKWVQRLGFKEVMFNDATVTADMEWAFSLFEGIIQNRIDLTWNCSTRADCLNPEVLKIMKEAGCHTIALGLESVDHTILKNIRKNTTPEQVKKAVSMIKKAGMNTILFCVVGFPGETRESIKNTISFLKALDTTFITLGIAVPVPGTDFYRYVEETKYLITKDWSLYDPMKKPVFSYPSLSADEIEYYSRHGLRAFYLRPGYILKRILSIKNFMEAKAYLKNFIGFIKRYVMRSSI